MRVDAATRRFVRDLAGTADGPTKHAAFMRGALREPLIDAIFMAEAMGDQPLTEDAMLNIAANWPEGEDADRGAES